MVVQDGARLHYAVPLALQERGALNRMFVEWYARPGMLSPLAAWVAERFQKGAGKRVLERSHPSLEAKKIRTKPILAYRLAAARARFSTPEEFFEWSSERVGEWVIRAGIEKPEDANGLFGFIRNISPKVCAAARAKGIKVVTDQMIAPMVEERRQTEIQAKRFPEWQVAAGRRNYELVEHVEAETWANSDHLACGSDYVRDSLVAAGQPTAKISVLPYPIEAAKYPAIDRRGRSGPVIVGCVGSVGLRKGSPYFVEVARRLSGRGARFVLVGPITVGAKLLGGAEAVGSVPRSEVPGWLEKFDVLFSPSTCEGSPGAVMEALATGLPVVTTPTSGTVVRYGVEGFVHPYTELDALTASVDRLISDRQLRAEMSGAARKRAEEFSLDWYGRKLVAVYERLLGQ